MAAMPAINLSRFCASDRDTRKHLQTPILIGTFAYATNGHVCVRVPAADCPEAHPLPDDVDMRKLPGMFDCIDKDPSIKRQPLPQLENIKTCERCKGASKFKVSDCEECDGKGEFIHGSHEYTCKECDGDGEVDDHQGTLRGCWECHGAGHDPHQYQDFGPGLPMARVGYMHWLAALPGIMWAPNGEERSIRFRFDGGHAILMPVRK